MKLEMELGRSTIRHYFYLKLVDSFVQRAHLKLLIELDWKKLEKWRMEILRNRWKKDSGHPADGIDPSIDRGHHHCDDDDDSPRSDPIGRVPEDFISDGVHRHTNHCPPTYGPSD